MNDTLFIVVAYSITGVLLAGMWATSWLKARQIRRVLRQQETHEA